MNGSLTITCTFSLVNSRASEAVLANNGSCTGAKGNKS